MIIISDVHACYKTLLALIEKLPHDNLCFVGDLIDRGPDSRSVVELVKNNYQSVKGNHEQMMIEAMTEENPRKRDFATFHWFNNGGNTTIQSYPEDQVLLAEHCEWMDTLPLYKEYANKEGQHFIISHSNINFAWNKRETDLDEFEHCALWSRDFDKTMWGESKIGSSKNIIGHTPQTYVKEEEELIFIDTGCVYGKEHGYGKLTAYDLETGEVYQQENIE